MPITLLAHGALGIWDELIFIAVVVVFVGLMGISWVQNRNAAPDFEDSPDRETDSEPKAKPSDHFELD